MYTYNKGVIIMANDIYHGRETKTLDDGTVLEIDELYNGGTDHMEQNVVMKGPTKPDEREQYRRWLEEEQQREDRERARKEAIRRKEENERKKIEEKKDEEKYNLEQARNDAKRRYRRENAFQRVVDYAKFRKIDHTKDVEQLNSLFGGKQPEKEVEQPQKYPTGRMTYAQRKEEEERQQALEDAKTNAKMRYRSQNPLKRAITKKQFQKIDSMTSERQVEGMFRK